jgi:hypothetical protein
MKFYELDSREQSYKYFYGCNLRILIGKRFQPSLKFAGKAGAYLSESTYTCSTLG